MRMESRGLSGKPEALDFAVCSGLRADLLRESTVTPELLQSRYEKFKREHDATEVSCQQAGIHFVPMVIEGHGGSWSPLARKVLDWMALAVAAATREPHSVAALRIAQRVSATLQRESARAVLRRSMHLVPGGVAASGWDGCCNAGAVDEVVADAMAQ